MTPARLGPHAYSRGSGAVDAGATGAAPGKGRAEDPEWLLREANGELAPIDQQFFPPVVADSFDMAAAAVAIARRPSLSRRLREHAVACRAALFGDGGTAEDLARFLWTAARSAAKQREVEEGNERAVLPARALEDERRKRSYKHAPPLYVPPPQGT